MGKFSGILICTDLDGTLYRNDKSISRENKDAIEYFKREGGYFTFITGRMPYYSQTAYNAVSPNAPFGCVNGGAIYDGANKSYVWTSKMPTEIYELIELVDRDLPGVGIQVCCYDRIYFSKDNNAAEEFRNATGVRNIVRNYKDVDEPIAMMLFGTDSEEEMQALDRTLRSHPLAPKFNFVRSEKTLYQIMPGGVHKGVALERLAEHLKIDMSKTIAIGDYDNDVGMLKSAGLGVAVSNASKAAIAAADVVTVSNEEHAIAKIIYDIDSGAIDLHR
jgi:Cof subfamily protein (haloacid dehalogenase superfamily)